MLFNDALKKWNGGIIRGARRRLAEKLSVAESVVGRWAAGRSRPGEGTQTKIAEIFGISREDIAAMFDPLSGASILRESSPPLYGSGVDMRTAARASFAPVLGVVSAERFMFSFDAIPEEQIPNAYPGKDVFALRISGDCMEPTFRDGEFVYLSKNQPVTDGKIVLARFDGEHTLKRYFKRADGIELRPDNPKFKTRTYASNKLEIVAVAIGRYGKL